METSNTDFQFDLNKNIPGVFMKLAYAPEEETTALFNSNEWDEEITDSELLECSVDRFNRTELRREHYRISDLLHRVTDRFKSAFLLSAMSLDLTRIPSFNSTRFYEIPPILRSYLEEKRIVLPPSNSLIMRRNDVQKSSLFAPSGAYLTWMEMIGESLPDDE